MKARSGVRGQRPGGLEVDVAVEVGRHAVLHALSQVGIITIAVRNRARPSSTWLDGVCRSQRLAQQAQHDDDAGERGQHQQHRRDQGDRRHQQQGLQRQADRLAADLADVDVRQRGGRRAGRGERQRRQQAQGKQQQPRHQGGKTGTGDTHVRVLAQPLLQQLGEIRQVLEVRHAHRRRWRQRFGQGMQGVDAAGGDAQQQLLAVDLHHHHALLGADTRLATSFMPSAGRKPLPGMRLSSQPRPITSASTASSASTAPNRLGAAAACWPTCGPIGAAVLPTASRVEASRLNAVSGSARSG
jgi:hypothetical protein